MSSRGSNVLSILRGLARPREPRESCELCGVSVAHEHGHLLEPSNGRIVCACEACAILFSHRTESGKFVRIPRDVRRLRQFSVSDAEWSGLLLPIDLAFFLHSSNAGKVVAFYPSPVGNTESLLSLDAWTGIAGNNPLLSRMAPDVEALLVNRTRGHCDYFIAPIDECYKLTGLIRTHWRGFSGGDEVWQHIDQFFDQLGERAIEPEDAAHA